MLFSDQHHTKRSFSSKEPVFLEKESVAALPRFQLLQILTFSHKVFIYCIPNVVSDVNKDDTKKDKLSEIQQK